MSTHLSTLIHYETTTFSSGTARPAGARLSVMQRTHRPAQEADTKTKPVHWHCPTALHAGHPLFEGHCLMQLGRSAPLILPLAGCHTTAAQALPASPSPQGSASNQYG